MCHFINLIVRNVAQHSPRPLAPQSVSATATRDSTAVLGIFAHQPHCAALRIGGTLWGSTAPLTMTDATRSALVALAAALAADRDAVDELSCYGSLPCHLADWIADNDDDDEEA